MLPNNSHLLRKLPPPTPRIVVLPRTSMFFKEESRFSPPGSLATPCNSPPSCPPALLSRWFCSFGPLLIDGTSGSKTWRLTRVCTHLHRPRKPRDRHCRRSAGQRPRPPPAVPHTHDETHGLWKQTLQLRFTGFSVHEPVRGQDELKPKVCCF